MYYVGYDEASPNGDYSCEIIYKNKNGIITVLAEKIKGRTTANVRFGWKTILTQIAKQLRTFCVKCTLEILGIVLKHEDKK